MPCNKRGRWRKPQKHGKPKGLRAGRSWLWDQPAGNLGQERSVLLQLSSASRLDIPCIQQTAVKPAEKALSASTKALLTACSSPSSAPCRDRGRLHQRLRQGSIQLQWWNSMFLQQGFPPPRQPTPAAHRSKPRVLSTCSCLSSLQHLYAPAHPAKSNQPHGSSAPAPHPTLQPQCPSSRVLRVTQYTQPSPQE